MSTPLTAECTTIVGLGSLIKQQNASFEISYGSGGFCVVIKTQDGLYHGYSWSLTDAISKAVKNLREATLQSIMREYVDTDEETPTHPEFRLTDPKKTKTK